jgi:hypothetical protein
MLTKKRAIPLFNFLIAQRVTATFITVYLQSFALAGISISIGNKQWAINKTESLKPKANTETSYWNCIYFFISHSTFFIQHFPLRQLADTGKIKAPRQKSGSFPLYGLNFLRHRVFSMALTCWVAPF